MNLVSADTSNLSLPRRSTSLDPTMRLDRRDFHERRVDIMRNHDKYNNRDLKYDDSQRNESRSRPIKSEIEYRVKINSLNLELAQNSDKLVALERALELQKETIAKLRDIADSRKDENQSLSSYESRSNGKGRFDQKDERFSRRNSLTSNQRRADSRMEETQSLSSYESRSNGNGRFDKKDKRFSRRNSLPTMGQASNQRRADSRKEETQSLSSSESRSNGKGRFDKKDERFFRRNSSLTTVQASNQKRGVTPSSTGSSQQESNLSYKKRLHRDRNNGHIDNPNEPLYAHSRTSRKPSKTRTDKRDQQNGVLLTRTAPPRSPLRRYVSLQPSMKSKYDQRFTGYSESSDRSINATVSDDDPLFAQRTDNNRHNTKNIRKSRSTSSGRLQRYPREYGHRKGNKIAARRESMPLTKPSDVGEPILSSQLRR